jgi:hypothetical protein
MEWSGRAAAPLACDAELDLMAQQQGCDWQRHPMADSPHGSHLRPARHRLDGRGIGMAINRCLKTPSGPQYLR